MNQQCYKYDNIYFKEGILDEIVDAVYVILLEGSNRTNNVYKQLNEFKLCKNNHIQINKGYKKCNKNFNNNKINSSNIDIIDSNIHVFNDAKQKNYNNILYLQDDFILDEAIKDNFHINNLKKFINNNNFNLYNLGCFSFLTLPTNYLTTLKSYFYLSAQSIIFSKKSRNIILKNYKNIKINKYIQDDIWYNSILDKKYYYYRPLCYQTFPLTENRKTCWSSFLILNFFISLFKLDKQVQPGWTFIYIGNYLFIILIILIILFILIKIQNYKFFYKRY